MAAFGALARYSIAGLLPEYGIIVVNISGSFIIGVLLHERFELSLTPDFKMAIMVGFLGSLTTFSSFSLESIKLLLGGQVLLASGYIVMMNVCSIGACLLGYHLFRPVLS